MASRTASARRLRSRGLTLVEILVGVAIGLIGIVAIFQAIAIWTKHTQTTSAGGDAQVAGTLALFNIERDLKQAGHGFGQAVTQAMGCVVNVTDTMALATNFNMRPVEIIAGAGGAPDQINVLYGDSAFYVQEGTYSGATVSSKTLVRRPGFKRGDLAVVAVNAGASAASANCQLIEVTNDNNVDGLTIDHTQLPYASYYAASGAPLVAPRFNSNVAPAGAGGNIYNLGPRPRLHTWTIQGNRVLARRDLLQVQPSGLMQIAEGVVNIKAEYGYDADLNGAVSDTEWVPVLPAGADWRRVFAIRVAVLVRSRQFERNGDTGASGTRAVTPTAANPYYFGDPVGHRFLMTDVNGTGIDSWGNNDAVPNNWRYYRYRVYERVIPLRNMLWGMFG